MHLSKQIAKTQQKTGVDVQTVSGCTVCYTVVDWIKSVKLSNDKRNSTTAKKKLLRSFPLNGHKLRVSTVHFTRLSEKSFVLFKEVDLWQAYHTLKTNNHTN